MRPSTFVLALAVLFLSDGTTSNLTEASQRAVVASTPAEADALYALRDDLPSALAAAAFWEQRLANDQADLEAASKLARACY